MIRNSLELPVGLYPNQAQRIITVYTGNYVFDKEYSTRIQMVVGHP